MSGKEPKVILPREEKPDTSKKENAFRIASWVLGVLGVVLIVAALLLLLVVEFVPLPVAIAVGVAGLVLEIVGMVLSEKANLLYTERTGHIIMSI